MVADEAECFSRIRLGGPWKWQDWHHKGAKGVLAFKGELPAELGEAKTCSDGLLYFHKASPSQEELAKSDTIPRFPVTLKSGRVIEIPIAVYAPRVLAFDCDGEGEHATEFGREAYRIWNRIDNKDMPTNGEIKRLIFLAVQQCYSVTEELLSNLGWVTDADMTPILLAVSGRDPKSVAVASDTSLSRVAAS